MANYWIINNDKSDDKNTIWPWEEKVSNGDKDFPEPKQKNETDKGCRP